MPATFQTPASLAARPAGASDAPGRHIGPQAALLLALIGLLSIAAAVHG